MSSSAVITDPGPRQRDSLARGGSDLLTVGALLYLTLPLVVFWVEYVGGAAAVVGLAWGLFALAFVRCSLRQRAPCVGAGIGAWLLWFGLALSVLWVTGFPGGPYPWDWIKHWALLSLLAENDWPIRIEFDGQFYALRFYVAAYMVPALIGKLTDGLPTWLFPALWFGAGMVLLFALMASSDIDESNRGLRVWAPALFLLMAGADLIVERGVRWLTDGAWLPLFGFHLEWWAADVLLMPAQYTSALSGLVWVPHQSIATGIAAILLARHTHVTPWSGIVAFGALSLWSPFGMIGLLPFVLWRLVQFRSVWCGSRFGWAMLALIGGASLAGALFLAGGAQEFHLLPGSRIEALRRLLLLLPFVLVELSPFALMLRRRMLAPGPLAIATISLLVLPWFAGVPLDFVLRVSLAPLFILFWVAAREMSGLLRVRPLKRFAAGVGLAIATATTVGETTFLITDGAAHRALASDHPLNRKSMTTFALSERNRVHEFFEICGWHYLPQYFEPVARPPRTGK